VGGVGNPSLGAPGQGIGEVVGVAEESIVDDADVGVFGDEVVVDCDSAWEDVAGQVVGDGRVETHRFLDAGFEVGAGFKGWAVADVGEGAESVADFGCQACACGRVMEQLPEGGGDAESHGFGSWMVLNVSMACICTLWEEAGTSSFDVPAPMKRMDSVKRSLRSKVRPVLGCSALSKALKTSGLVLSSPRATRSLEAPATHFAMPFTSDQEKARKSLPRFQRQIKGCAIPCRHALAEAYRTRRQ